MRYWHPFSLEAIEQVQKYQPDEIILLPLYPQFSTTTTASSSYNEFIRVASGKEVTKTIKANVLQARGRLHKSDGRAD